MSETQALHYERISAAAKKCAEALEGALKLVSQANNEYGEQVGDEVEMTLLWTEQALRFAERKILEEGGAWQSMAVRERQMDRQAEGVIG